LKRKEGKFNFERSLGKYSWRRGGKEITRNTRNIFQKQRKSCWISKSYSL